MLYAFLTASRETKARCSPGCNALSHDRANMFGVFRFSCPSLSLLRCVCEADGPACATFERSMRYPGVCQKVEPRLGIPSEELVRQHIPFHAITGPTGNNEVPRHVRSPTGEGINVIDCGRLDL